MTTRSPRRSTPMSTSARSAASSRSRPTPSPAWRSRRWRRPSTRSSRSSSPKGRRRRSSSGSGRSTWPASSGASSASAASAASPTSWPRARSYGGSPDAYQNDPRPHEQGHGRGRQGDVGPLALRRRLHPRGHSLSPARRREERRRPEDDAGGRRRARSEVPGRPAGDPAQRPEDHAGRAALHPRRRLQPDAGRRVRGRPVRGPRHGQPGHEHDRRGHGEADVARDQRPAGFARRPAPGRVEPRHLVRRAQHPQGQARRRPRRLRRRHPQPRLPGGGFPAPAEDPDRPDRPGEGLARHDDPPGVPGPPLRPGARLREPVHGLGHRSRREQARPGGPRQVPPDLVQAQ